MAGLWWRRGVPVAVVVAGGLWAGGVGGGAMGQGFGTSGSGGVVEVEAVARASEDLALAFTIAGRVGEVAVEEGERVEAGAVLMRLDDRLARFDERLAGAQAASTASLDVARSTLGLLETELDRVRDAQARDAAATFEVERKALEVRRAKAQVAIEEEARERAAVGLERARFVVGEHELRSPISGVVERVIVSEGETVEALRPVLRLVRTEPLRVEASVPTWRTLTIGSGDRAWVRVEVGAGGAWMEGEVRSVSSVADAGSDTRVVRVDVVNRAGFPAGARVVVRFVEPGVVEGEER